MPSMNAIENIKTMNQDCPQKEMENATNKPGWKWSEKQSTKHQIIEKHVAVRTAKTKFAH